MFSSLNLKPKAIDHKASSASGVYEPSLTFIGTLEDVKVALFTIEASAVSLNK